MTMFAEGQTFADKSVISLMPPIGRVSYITHIQPLRLQAHFFGDISPEWTFVRLFPVYFELDEDVTHIVSDEIFLVYGNGDNPLNAISDYISSLIEFYKILEEGAKTSPFDQGQLNNLRAYFRHI